MEYLIGLLLSLAIAGLAALIGFDRERAFYPTVLIVIASYYVLFAVMGASSGTLWIEIAVAAGFFLFALLGFKRNLWFVVAALVAHGAFDYVHHLFIQNPGVPPWWPGFCLAFDGVLGALLAARLLRHSTGSRPVELAILFGVFLALFFETSASAAKSYSYFCVGRAVDIAPATTVGTVLMGGGTDVDAAAHHLHPGRAQVCQSKTPLTYQNILVSRINASGSFNLST